MRRGERAVWTLGTIGRALVVLLAFCWVSLAHAAPARADADVARCAALAQADFSTTRDAAFVVTGADADGALCTVAGYVVPEITFEIRLPLSGWNGGFVLVGSGGWATEKFVFLCKEPLRRGYACIAGDAGHQNGQGLWMRANAQAKIDWGYRATHASALAGKALVRALYGAPPRVSLMIGTSTGGYQGLVEAQRFPQDFDGIVAVAPDIDEAGLAMRTLWTQRNLTDAGGKPLFTGDALSVLHRAALAACDRSDGLADGVVGDPLGCEFDPRTAVCRAGATDCLSAAQATAAARIYAGPATSSGERLAAGGLLPGSELNWAEVAEDRFPDQFFRSALGDTAIDGVTAATFDFDHDVARLGLAGTLVSSNPDLRRFRQAGGKLLLVQGANDATEQPPVLVDYYRTVERVIGSRGETRTFARLFVVPGMNHATGGDGAFAIDYLTAIERWVTTGDAPAMLIGAHVPDWAKGFGGMTAGLTAPTADRRVTFTRPAYPYPAVPRYSGRGDPDDFRSFKSADGAERPF